MSNSDNPEDRGDRHDLDDKAAKDLGFDSLTDFDIAWEGVHAIDERLNLLLHDNQAGGIDPEMRDIALVGNFVWGSIRDKSLNKLPFLQLSKRGGLKKLRFAYLAYSPQHSFEFTVYPGRVIDYKLVLNRHIQFHEVSGSGADIWVRPAWLLERYALGVAATSSNVHPMEGPLDSQDEPSYMDVAQALGFQNFSASNCAIWSTVDDITNGLSRLSAAHPLRESDTEVYWVVSRALAVWDDVRDWCIANEIPIVAYNESSGQAYFGYKQKAPNHSFELVISSDSTSHCLVDTGRVVSYDPAGALAGALGGNIFGMDRYAPAAHGVPFVSPAKSIMTNVMAEREKDSW